MTTCTNDLAPYRAEDGCPHGFDLCGDCLGGCRYCREDMRADWDGARE